MSEILVIVPSEWVQQNMDAIAQMTGFSMSYMETLPGSRPTDLNDRLEAAGYFPGDKRVIDVLVINGAVYFKFE